VIAATEGRRAQLIQPEGTTRRSSVKWSVNELPPTVTTALVGELVPKTRAGKVGTDEELDIARSAITIEEEARRELARLGNVEVMANSGGEGEGDGG